MGDVEKIGRRRGRPRGFDLDAVLERAAAVFDRNGYEGASVNELATAARITPQSLYAAFRSKEHLYRAALDWYAQGDGQSVATILGREGDVVAAVQAMLHDCARRYTAGQRRGCLISSGMLASGEAHAALREHLVELRAMARDWIASRLRRAVDKGQLSASFDVAAMASFLAATIQGMSVAARDGADEATLRAIAELATQPLKHAIKHP